MEKQEKKVIDALFSTDKKIVLDTIDKIRSMGQPVYIKPLIELYFNSPLSETGTAIIALLNDIKAQEAAPFIAESLNIPADKPGLSKLIAVCWQNGLNYTGHLHVFARHVIHANYEISVEAFTVIEENLDNAEHDEIIQLEKQVKNGLLKTDDTKQMLVKELHSLLEGRLQH